VWLALREGRKVFYTTPLKALSNQKFNDLVTLHGAANVGLLTGDNSINPTAPVVVMTTDVLRNMIYERSDLLEDLRYGRPRRGATTSRTRTGGRCGRRSSSTCPSTS